MSQRGSKRHAGWRARATQAAAAGVGRTGGGGSSSSRLQALGEPSMPDDTPTLSLATVCESRGGSCVGRPRRIAASSSVGSALLLRDSLCLPAPAMTRGCPAGSPLAKVELHEAQTGPRPAE